MTPIETCMLEFNWDFEDEPTLEKIADFFRVDIRKFDEGFGVIDASLPHRYLVTLETNQAEYLEKNRPEVIAIYSNPKFEPFNGPNSPEVN